MPYYGINTPVPQRNNMKLKKIESWINREINIIVKQLETAKRYQKAHMEGALSALKKVQNKIINTPKD